MGTPGPVSTLNFLLVATLEGGGGSEINFNLLFQQVYLKRIQHVINITSYLLLFLSFRKCLHLEWHISELTLGGLCTYHVGRMGAPPPEQGGTEVHGAAPAEGGGGEIPQGGCSGLGALRHVGEPAGEELRSQDFSCLTLLYLWDTS